MLYIKKAGNYKLILYQAYTKKERSLTQLEIEGLFNKRY